MFLTAESFKLKAVYGDGGYRTPVRAKHSPHSFTSVDRSRVLRLILRFSQEADERKSAQFPGLSLRIGNGCGPSPNR